MTLHTPFYSLTGYTPFIEHLETSRVDVVGDVHGCYSELFDLLARAGYQIGRDDGGFSTPISLYHPEGRRLVFIGDLTDRGPASDLVLRLALGGRMTGTATVIMGNHDWKLFRTLAGGNTTVTPEAMRSVEQIEAAGPDFPNAVLALYRQAPHQVRLPVAPDHPLSTDGFITLVHGAARAHRQDRSDKRSFERSVYGYSTGEVDASGGLVRIDWAAEYAGARGVVHGHTPVKAPRRKNGVLCIDTGCVFGNALTLYRVDSDTCLSVTAERNHAGETRILG